MKKGMIAFLLVAILFACNDEKSTAPPSENEVDAARNFIRSSLDRDWDKARNYMLQDSANLERLSNIEASTSSEKKEVRTGYKEASIQLYETRKLNDSISIIPYSNSYKNKKDSLKVVRVNGQWLVDLKYTFLPLMPDSLQK